MLSSLSLVGWFEVWYFGHIDIRISFSGQNFSFTCSECRDGKIQSASHITTPSRLDLPVTRSRSSYRGTYRVAHGLGEEVSSNMPWFLHGQGCSSVIYPSSPTRVAPWQMRWDGMPSRAENRNDIASGCRAAGERQSCNLSILTVVACATEGENDLKRSPSLLPSQYRIKIYLFCPLLFLSSFAVLSLSHFPAGKQN